jgi:cyanate lyase
MDKEKMRELLLAAKEVKNLTWEQIGKEIGRNALGTAMLVYGYGIADDKEAEKLSKLLELSKEVEETLKKVSYRMPVQPWPPTDPFVYRFYEIVMLYGPVIKEVAHEMFGDGIMSAIDMKLDIKKVEEDETERAEFIFNGKWLKYKRF